MMKEPYYLLDYNISLTNFDILINGVLAFSHDSAGSIYSNYPINHLILSSGLQQIAIRFRPLANVSSIHKDASAIIKVQYLDASTMDQEQLTTVYEYKMPKAESDTLPMLESIGEFKAEVPYRLIGWSDASIIDIKNEVTLELIHNYYRRIHTLFKDKDVNALALLLKKRYEETDTSMYLEEDNIVALNNIFKMIDAEGYVMQDFPDVPKVVFYAKNRVINLIREDKSPIISYLKKAENEEFGFPFYIYLPKGNTGFEIIR
ncbi:hypothetical protein SAMN05421827_12721 [Pedobacter terrae]|uniref:Uncharacterized protein n=1 Tax=Pedobacter terrae TaxID=405671 RepID=A0A1G8CXP3_9SPHI|nr:hypothetical protein [Pedobacter terrae]SDH50225.1 hypothetical protein SAMN05421827_12721 [Pedobacter terrae]